MKKNLPSHSGLQSHLISKSYHPNSFDRQAFSSELARAKGQLIQAARRAEDEFGKRYPGLEPGEELRGIAVLHAEQLDTVQPVSLVITYESWGEIGAWMIALVFGKLSDEMVQRVATQSIEPQEELGEFLLTHSNDQWNLGHRIVQQEFRRMGVGDTLLAVVEEFLQRRAIHVSRPQTITLKAGQFDVFNWLLKNGFEPSEPKDRNHLENIFRGDTGYSMGEDLYIFHNEDRNIPTPFIGHRALKVRLKFQKEITVQGLHLIDTAIHDTRSSLKQAI